MLIFVTSIWFTLSLLWVHWCSVPLIRTHLFLLYSGLINFNNMGWERRWNILINQSWRCWRNWDNPLPLLMAKFFSWQFICGCIIATWLPKLHGSPPIPCTGVTKRERERESGGGIGNINPSRIRWYLLNNLWGWASHCTASHGCLSSRMGSWGWRVVTGTQAVKQCVVGRTYSGHWSLASYLLWHAERCLLSRASFGLAKPLQINK